MNLSYVHVPGSGFCFYDSCARQLGVANFRVLGMAALLALAVGSDDFREFVVGEDASQRRQAVSSLTECADVMDRLDDFDCYVLDKLEGLLNEAAVDTRRWAEDVEISALLAKLNLCALVLRPQDVEASMWKPSNRLVRHPEDLQALATDAPDLFFLHWSDGAYEHFATVGKTVEEGEESDVWFVPADRRASALAFLQTMKFQVLIL